MQRKLVGIGVSLALFATVLISQNSGGGASVFGTITDPAGAVVANAPVELRAGVTGGRWSTTSNGTGQYYIGKLSAGSGPLRNVPPC